MFIPVLSTESLPFRLSTHSTPSIKFSVTLRHSAYLSHSVTRLPVTFRHSVARHTVLTGLLDDSKYSLHDFDYFAHQADTSSTNWGDIDFTASIHAFEKSYGSYEYPQ